MTYARPSNTQCGAITGYVIAPSAVKVADCIPSGRSSRSRTNVA
jgi:hypothetical protein